MEEQEKIYLGLSEHLLAVPDPRVSHKITYRLDEILFLAVSAVVSDCMDWQDIVDFGHDKLEWLQKYFPYEQGIPSHDTMNRVFSLIDKDAFAAMFHRLSESLSCPIILSQQESRPYCDQSSHALPKQFFTRQWLFF